MGLAIYPSKLKEQISSMDSILEGNKACLNIIIDDIEKFIENPKLEGTAWTNVKVQMENHISLIRGIIQGSDEIISDSKTLIYLVGDEDIIEDEIRESIQELNACISDWLITANTCKTLMNSQYTGIEVSGYYAYMYAKYLLLINDSYNIIAMLESKLETLYWITKQTIDLYNGAETLFTHVQNGLNSISDFDVNAPTCVLDNNSWKINLDLLWSIRSQENIEKGTITSNWLNDNATKNIYKIGMTIAENITDEELIRLISIIAEDEDWPVYGITYLSNDNYLNNLRLEREGFKDENFIKEVLVEGKYINRQHIELFEHMRLGVATLNHTGCECIATYNAMVSLGNKQDLSNIVRYYDADSLMARGVFGTNPYEIPKYFSTMGYDVYVTDDVKTFDDNYLKDSDTIIISYTTGDGVMGISMVHTVCVVKEGEKKYRVYNDGGLTGVYADITAIEEALKPTDEATGASTTTEASGTDTKKLAIEIVEIIGVENK